MQISDVRRTENETSQSFEKGQACLSALRVIKPLENDSSNRSITLQMTGPERGRRAQYFLFRASEASHLCRSSVLHHWLMNGFGGGRTNTDTHIETRTAGAFPLRSDRQTAELVAECARL